jgi:hypothetical protein
MNYSKSGHDLTPLSKEAIGVIVQKLEPIEVEVTQRAGTERAFTGRYWDEHRKGLYVCAVGGLPLFRSETKFESGTGWPSFTGASTFRGQKQVTLQFEDFRVTEENPVEIRKPKVELTDWRLATTKLNELDSNVLIWAEGADKDKGKSRYDLQKADEFAIYTTPPSPVDLLSALETVRPYRIHIFGVAPNPVRTHDFLSHLAGMAKYAINNKNGRASIKDFAAAVAQRESAIRIGLEWLAAGGHISVIGEDDALILSNGNDEANQYLQKELFVAVKGILEETAAYRAHFAEATINNLIDSN